MKGEGYVYVLSNISFRDDLYKIGMTRRSVEERKQELSAHSGVPTPFRIEVAESVVNCEFAEALIHQKLTNFRFNAGREFFLIPLDKAKRIVTEITESVNELATAEPITDETIGRYSSDRINAQGLNVYVSEFECSNCARRYKVTLMNQETETCCPYCLLNTQLNIDW